jgi:hypothetical protein
MHKVLSPLVLGAVTFYVYHSTMAVRLEALIHNLYL